MHRVLLISSVEHPTRSSASYDSHITYPEPISTSASDRFHCSPFSPASLVFFAYPFIYLPCPITFYLSMTCICILSVFLSWIITRRGVAQSDSEIHTSELPAISATLSSHLTLHTPHLFMHILDGDLISSLEELNNFCACPAPRKGRWNAALCSSAVSVHDTHSCEPSHQGFSDITRAII